MVAFGIETINQAQPQADRNGLDDSISYNLGANYNAGWAKFFFYTQIFENYTSAAKTTPSASMAAWTATASMSALRFPPSAAP